MFKKLLLTLLFTGFTTLNAYNLEAHALNIEIFNPGEKACSQFLPKLSAANTRWS